MLLAKAKKACIQMSKVSTFVQQQALIIVILCRIHPVFQVAWSPAAFLYHNFTALGPGRHEASRPHVFN